MIRYGTDVSLFVIKYGYIFMTIKENGYQEPSLPGSCGYIFVLAFCILMIFCLHIWKATPLNYPRATSGEIPTTPLPLGVNLVIGLYYRQGFQTLSPAILQENRLCYRAPFRTVNKIHALLFLHEKLDIGKCFNGNGLAFHHCGRGVFMTRLQQT